MNANHRGRACLLASLVLSGLLVPSALAAQDGAWDSPRVLRMIEDARMRRALPYEDSALRNYRANAHGYIYFYLDRESEDELTLVKVDQVALEVYWAYPGSTKQRIVGLRDESVLPNRMRYHLDHLTVVQNEFGDRINLGDGDEVQSVVHPIAPESERQYSFRLADSLTLRLGGLTEPLRVYEIEVRPRDPSTPGFVGSVFIDAAASDIVRMDFTFTRSSYVDRRLDYIRISLENGLWQGRFWLPYEQQVELRRQLPELDFPAGAVIRGRMQVRDYEFNLDLPPSLFRGPAVTAVPQSTREAYPFEEELFAELAEEGLAADPDLEALEEEAAELIGRRFLQGLPPVRLDLRGASSVLRFDRTERLHVGLGLSYRLGEAIARAGAGYSFGTEEPTGRVGLDFDAGGWDVGTQAWWNEPRDLGYQATAGVMNTLSALAAEAGADFGHDFRDTWFSRGLSLGVERRLGESWRVGLTAMFEDQRPPELLVEGFEADPDDELDRPLAVIEEGTDRRAIASIDLVSPPETAHGSDLSVGFEAGLFTEPEGIDPGTNRTYGRFTFDWRGRAVSADHDLRFLGRVRAGGLLGSAPVQHAFLLGGMGTVPGYPFRSYGGDVSMLIQVEGRRAIRAPWVSARLGTAVGVIDMIDEDVAEVWTTVEEGAPIAVGAGVGLVNEILWIDVWRGTREDGDWEVLITVDPRLWDIL